MCQTERVDATVDPVWDFACQVTDYQLGDSLKFTIWDKDWVQPDDCLGTVTLASEDFHPGGFEGELPLVHASSSAKPTLRIKVIVEPQAIGELRPEDSFKV